MNVAEILEYIGDTNRWRAGEGLDWARDDFDLKEAEGAPFAYRPRPLADLQPGAMCVLSGPRRVGKSVEVKRAIEELIAAGVDRRRVFHASCDGWLEADLRRLVEAIDTLADPGSGHRYVFLDEVTAVGGDWVARIKWLRDNASLRNDCVVLTGSSSEQLAMARKQFAGRRGRESRTFRTLLPMGFGAFARAIGVELPAVEPIPPSDLLTPRADAAITELSLYTEKIVSAWEIYLRVGGYPRAVADWRATEQVSPGFIQDLWDVIHGDALAADDWSEGQSRLLLDRLARNLGSPLSVDGLVRELGDVGREQVTRRLRRLEHTFTAWQCPQGDARSTHLRARRKFYFLDPLTAGIVTSRGVGTAPRQSQLSEQQVGVALLARQERDHPGSLTEPAALMYQRSATGREIDFVGPALQGVPVESKYSDGPWLRATQTARTAYGGRAVLATRSTTDRRDDARALPAGALAYLLDPTPHAG